MISYSKKKIFQSKLNLSPFPYFVVKNLIPSKDLNKIIKILPGFEDILDKDIYYQSISKTKKTLLPSSAGYKKLNKNVYFKNLNKIFMKLKPQILKKFEGSIQKHVNKKFQKSKLSYHSTYSVMRKGYLKSAHLDRRDHLLHILFYLDSDSSNGGEIKIMRLELPKLNSSA